ncbi:hypothetical protein ABIA38_005032 [Embleya sp. AB8]
MPAGPHGIARVQAIRLSFFLAIWIKSAHLGMPSPDGHRVRPRYFSVRVVFGMQARSWFVVLPDGHAAEPGTAAQR